MPQRMSKTKKWQTGPLISILRPGLFIRIAGHLPSIRTADPCDGFRALIRGDGVRGHGLADNPGLGMENGCHTLAPWASYTGRQAHGRNTSNRYGDLDNGVSSDFGDDGEFPDGGA